MSSVHQTAVSKERGDFDAIYEDATAMDLAIGPIPPNAPDLEHRRHGTRPQSHPDPYGPLSATQYALMAARRGERRRSHLERAYWQDCHAPHSGGAHKTIVPYIPELLLQPDDVAGISADALALR